MFPIIHPLPHNDPDLACSHTSTLGCRLGSDAALHPSTPTPPRRPRASAPHAAHVAWAVDASGSPLHDGRPGSSGGGVARGAGLSSAARSRLAAVEVGGGRGWQLVELVVRSGGIGESCYGALAAWVRTTCSL